MDRQQIVIAEQHVGRAAVAAGQVGDAVFGARQLRREPVAQLGLLRRQRQQRVAAFPIVTEAESPLADRGAERGRRLSRAGSSRPCRRETQSAAARRCSRRRRTDWPAGRRQRSGAGGGEQGGESQRDAAHCRERPRGQFRAPAVSDSSRQIRGYRCHPGAGRLQRADVDCGACRNGGVTSRSSDPSCHSWRLKARWILPLVVFGNAPGRSSAISCGTMSCPATTASRMRPTISSMSMRLRQVRSTSWTMTSRSALPPSSAPRRPRRRAGAAPGAPAARCPRYPADSDWRRG